MDAATGEVDLEEVVQGVGGGPAGLVQVCLCCVESGDELRPGALGQAPGAEPVELVHAAGPGGEVRGRGVQLVGCVGEPLPGAVVTRRILFKVGEGEDGLDGGGVGAGVQACLVCAVELGEPHQGSLQLFVGSGAVGGLQSGSLVGHGEFEARVGSGRRVQVGLILQGVEDVEEVVGIGEVVAGDADQDRQTVQGVGRLGAGDLGEQREQTVRGASRYRQAQQAGDRWLGEGGVAVAGERVLCERGQISYGPVA